MHPHGKGILEKGVIKIPDPETPDVGSKYFTLIQQMKAYHYDEKGKPVKINDDCVDSMLCAMKHSLHPIDRGLPIARSVK